MNQVDLHTDIDVIQKLLQEKGWLSEDETIQAISSPGAGNMNVVLRVKTNQRSFILKQSRPYVQKYQQIPAPAERIAVEYNFYKAVDSPIAQNHFPRLLGYDASEYLLQLQDLGDCRVMTYLYEERSISAELQQSLLQILYAIHQQQLPENYPDNMALRKLNHQHIFQLPFQADNGFDLDTVHDGLQELSLPFKHDPEISRQVESLGKKYLSKGGVLLHGDYYPGSWMSRDGKVFVIDPEFSFGGFAEFDLGVMAAHLFMASSDYSYPEAVANEYPGQVNITLIRQIAGTEVARRIIGLAQLHLSRNLEEKEYLLSEAKKMILS